MQLNPVEKFEAKLNKKLKINAENNALRTIVVPCIIRVKSKVDSL